MQPKKFRITRTWAPVAFALLAGSATVVTSVAASSVMLPFHAVVRGATDPRFTSPCTIVNNETGAGTATHFGAMTWESREIASFDSCGEGFPSTPDITVHGTFKITAANGDEIRGTYTTWGTLDQTGVKVSGPFIFVSGTGRFRDVKGGGIILAEATVLTEATATMNGTIKY